MPTTRRSSASKSLWYGVAQSATATTATTVFKFTSWDEAMAFAYAGPGRGLPFKLNANGSY